MSNKAKRKKSAHTKTTRGPVKTLNIIRISPAYYCDPSYLDLVISTTWRSSTLGSGEALPNWLVYCDSFLWLGWHANLWVSNERWLRQSSRPSAFQLWYITFCPPLTHSKSVDQREGLGLRKEGSPERSGVVWLTTFLPLNAKTVRLTPELINMNEQKVMRDDANVIYKHVVAVGGGQT